MHTDTHTCILTHAHMHTYTCTCILTHAHTWEHAHMPQYTFASKDTILQKSEPLKLNWKPLESSAGSVFIKSTLMSASEYSSALSSSLGKGTCNLCPQPTEQADLWYFFLCVHLGWTIPVCLVSEWHMQWVRWEKPLARKVDSCRAQHVWVTCFNRIRACQLLEQIHWLYSNFSKIQLWGLGRKSFVVLEFAETKKIVTLK